MKKMKKLFAVLLTLAMMLGMSATVFAAPQNEDLIPRPQDTVNVTINGVGEGAAVTLYKIVKADYATNDMGLTGYTAVEGVDLASLANQPTSQTINQIANGLLSEAGAEGHIAAYETITDGTVVNGTYTKDVAAGVYIAIISKAADGTIYNPILLTAAYAPEGGENNAASQLVGGAVSTGDHYLWGATAVAKSTKPGIDKEITGGTTEDTTMPEDTSKATASIGDKIDFKVTPTVPSYPTDAVNKTFFISDNMDKGLTFDYETLEIAISGKEVTKRVSGDVTEFVMDGKVIAKSVKTENGFNLAFQYDNLISDATTGSIYTPVVTYSAIVNENATIGINPNTNTAELFYANQPNKGSSYDDPNEKPDPQKDETISKEEDKETVYTYRLAFMKTDDAQTDPKPLAGAVFGIYDEAGNLVDVVTTNEKGYAESTNVKAGTYTVKELVAPDGYTLNTTEYKITASWAMATTVVTGTVTNCEYTSEQNESLDGVQVGWLKGNQFYAMDEFTGEEEGVVKAYVKKTSTTSTSMTEVVENKEGAGVSMMKEAIPNTKLTNLPSTGGIGTTIFTIGGCAIMVVAAGLFFASRRKSAK